MARSTLSSKLFHNIVAAWCILLGIAQAACARTTHQSSEVTEGIPPGYYKGIDHKSGKQLKGALTDVLLDHTVFGYGELWYRYEKTDIYPGTDNRVFDYYSPAVYYFTGTGRAPSCANKEHACPQSWWGGGGLCNAYSDIFNVLPSETNANAKKSNYPLGVVASAEYENGCMKVGPSALSDYRGKVFEPCDEYKGDFARIYFYVATCYARAAWGSKASVASTCPFVQEDYPTIRQWLLPLLLKWNAQDPVSEWEVHRNDLVYSEQGNRNPFVDYPQLADYIWGNNTKVAFDLASAVVNGSASGKMDDGIYHEGEETGSEEVQPAAVNTEEPVGDYLLDDTFASAVNGDNLQNTGSANAWAGDRDFPGVTKVYQAGGAIKLGSSKGAGSITSRSLGNKAGDGLKVEIEVKGWNTIEGSLMVQLTGCEAQTVSYTHTMAEGFETVTVTFAHCPANAVLTIGTSAKRAFLDRVCVSGL